MIVENTASEELARSGWTVLPSAFRETEIDGLRDAVTETVDRVARALLTPFETSCPGEPLEDRLEKAAQKDRAIAGALLQAVLADAQRDPRAAALPSHPVLSARVRELVRPSAVSGHSVRFRVSSPTLTVHRSPWHQDVSELPPAADRAPGCHDVRLACWIPLSDVDENTGALEVLPGAWTGPLPHRPAGDGRFFVDEADLPSGPRRVVPLKKGDALVLDRFLPHRALPVRHGRSRWAAVMWVKGC